MYIFLNIQTVLCMYILKQCTTHFYILDEYVYIFIDALINYHLFSIPPHATPSGMNENEINRNKNRLITLI